MNADDGVTTARNSPGPTRNELAAEVLRSYGELRLRVKGSSMLPAVWPGDVMSVRHCAPEDTAVGDLVLFTRHGRLFAHRVVRRTDECLVTRGDGMAKTDPPVTGPELVGRVSQIDRRGRRFRPAAKLSFGGQIAAAIFRCSEGLGRLVIRRQTLPHASP